MGSSEPTSTSTVSISERLVAVFFLVTGDTRTQWEFLYGSKDEAVRYCEAAQQLPDPTRLELGEVEIFGPKDLHTESGQKGSSVRDVTVAQTRRETFALRYIFEGNAQEPSQVNEYAMIRLMLKSAMPVVAPVTSIPEATATALADQICSLLVSTIKFTVKDDKWLSNGRTVFHRGLMHFIVRGLKIELCLPAFPCKSSNLDKVGGTSPDRGEYIALDTLNLFVQRLEELYSPGGLLWVISDGHVFSDCIGVDDSAVDTYGDELNQMNERITLQRGGVTRVKFLSLVDILHLEGNQNHCAEAISLENLPPVKHWIRAVKLNSNAEVCRKVLLAAFGANASSLRAQIDAEDQATVALYRGFSRFMLDDLKVNKYTASISKNQRKKLASKVAFEMIARNQAYSKLIEILFPHHMRLSIHAHDNSGPKFGVQLLGGSVRSDTALMRGTDLMDAEDSLHIPTPWHGCIVELSTDNTLYMSKSLKVRSITSDNFEVTWETSSEDAKKYGAFFRLTPRQSIEPSLASVLPASSITPLSDTANEVVIPTRASLDVLQENNSTASDKLAATSEQELIKSCVKLEEAKNEKTQASSQENAASQNLRKRIARFLCRVDCSGLFKSRY